MAIVHALIGFAFLKGFAVTTPGAIQDSLKMFQLTPVPPAVVPKAIPPKLRSKRPEGAAAPPNLKSEATDISVPPPIVMPIVPPPLIAAKTPGLGSEATSGSAAVVGPGTGSGGMGTGRGGGGFGDGDGGGGRDEIPPRWRKGRIKDSDYPHAPGDAGIGGRVDVRYIVLTTGRVTGCRVTHSSGNTELDATTCHLIEERFRYDPSRDSYGRPVESAIIESHSWAVEDDPAPPVAEVAEAPRRKHGLNGFTLLPRLPRRISKPD